MVYTNEFRMNAIKRFEEVGSYWKAAKELRVSIATLHRWVRLSQQPPATTTTASAADATR